MRSAAVSPKYSVVVPAYQAAGLIAGCIRALDQQSVSRDDYEVIVVDDGSTDETAVVAQKEAADRVMVCEHQGRAAARNAGLGAARGEIILFTDADCEPVADWIQQMVAPFADPEIMGTKGAYRSRQTPFAARLVQLEYEIRYERMASLPRIDFIDTYSAAYRRDLLLRYGGFDHVYPDAEDVDLSFRLARDGHKFVFVPAARVWHRHPTSLKAYLVRKVRYGFWRALLYLRYPDKIGGDAHTDPGLKMQFALIALAGLSVLAAFLWTPLAILALGALAAFVVTTLPFSRWAWPRDRAVALAWPGVDLLRVIGQGLGLAVGLVWHGFLARERKSPAPHDPSRHNRPV